MGWRGRNGRLSRASRSRRQRLLRVSRTDSQRLGRHLVRDFFEYKLGIHGSDYAGIPGTGNHGCEFARLELLEGPLQRVGHGGPIPVKPYILIARPIMVVRALLEAIERQQFDLLASDIAEHVNRHTAVVAELPESSPNLTLPASMTTSPRLWVTVRRCLRAIYLAASST